MNNSNINLDTSIIINKKTKRDITIRPVNAKDEMVWKEMWIMYNNFYGANITEEITSSIWSRILNKSSAISALIAEDNNGVVLGFANYVLHEYTWSSGLACLMDDIFVIPKLRGRGAAKLLIETLINMAKENRWTRVYWMTREGNAAARSLYDKFCYNDGFVRYTISLNGIRSSGGNDE